jgi:DNA-binding transcriptional ArsR family regulator
MQMDDALRAIADPRRREILELVRERELPAGAIAAQFDVTWPAVSQHLRVLREAGLVTERRAGTSRFYRARPEALGDVRQFVERFWDVRLDQLKQEAEASERSMRHGADRN